MPTPLEKPQAPPPPQPPAAGGLGSRESQIRVIPEPYYGVALKLEPPFVTDEEEKPEPVPVHVPETPKPVPPAPAVPVPPPVEHRSRLWLIGLVIFVLLAGAGGWVAWNRQALFGKVPAPVVPVVEAPIAPNAPSDLAATSPTAGVARLVWQDRSQTESGYRIERKGPADQSFSIIQNLPANSLTFLDPTAPAGVTSTYRVTAFNPGGDSTPEITGQIFVLAPPPAAPPAPTLPPDGLDLDSDGLTNTEESVYGSNGQLPDTDGDGYLDGNEVFNLYAPTVNAPATLLSLTSMQAVTSTVGWQTLLPKAWAVERAEGSADVRVRPGTGEVFVFRVEANASRQPIRDWLLAQKGVSSAQVTELMSNKYKVPFFLGPDRLIAYVPWGDQVLTVSYQLGTQSFVNYRTSFGLMLNALRLAESPTLPDLTGPNTIPPAFQMTATSTSPTVSSTPLVVPPPASSSTVAVPMPSSTVPQP